jgi:oxygen-independent coproporphyrinogen III oxidase
LELDEKQRRAEYAFLGLRLSEGINLREFNKTFGADLTREFSAELARFRQAELIELTENNLRLSKKGMLYSNEVFSLFV